MAIVTCPLCAAMTAAIRVDQPGYQRATLFNIYACVYCDVQFVWPLAADREIYEAVYREAQHIPGYGRYFTYADTIAEAADPLEWLSRQEDAYWFVRTALMARGLAPGARVLEVGSGLGYLTHALRRAGFDAFGLDLATVAVESATVRFGPYYRCEDVVGYAEAHANSVDLIVMTEVIEHLPDPFPVLEAVGKILRPDGMALVTTPNKSAHALRAIWQTDNPPVHLWWYSETAMRQIARRLGLDIEFGDFTGFNEQSVGSLGAAKYRADRPNSPIFDEAMNLISGSIPDPGWGLRSHFKALRDGILPAWQATSRVRNYRRKQARIAASRSTTMGVMLRNRAA